MKDRSNIIKEAIEYRDKLEAKVKELAQSVVRLQISLDFADNTIKKKDRENVELKAENETLKSLLDYEVQKKEVFEAKNERLEEEKCKFKEYCTCKTEKYVKCLQEIKEIAEKECKDCLNKRDDSCWICPYYPILDLITKAESEG